VPEKIFLIKISFMEKFGVTNSINKEEFSKFFLKYYGNNEIIDYCEHMFGYKTIDEMKIYDTIDGGKNKMRLTIASELLNMIFGTVGIVYTMDDLKEIKILYADYQSRLLNILKKSEYFKDEEKNHWVCFGNVIRKRKPKAKKVISTTAKVIVTTKKKNSKVPNKKQLAAEEEAIKKKAIEDALKKKINHIGLVVRSILAKYSIHFINDGRVTDPNTIKEKPKQGSKINPKKVTKTTRKRIYNYKLFIDPEIKQIIEYKFKGTRVDNFPTIFKPKT